MRDAVFLGDLGGRILVAADQRGDFDIGDTLERVEMFLSERTLPRYANFHFCLSKLSCLSHSPSRRHCERSEAIQCGAAELDCFVASLLAMTVSCECDRLLRARQRASSCRRTFWICPQPSSRRAGAAPE